MQPFLHSVPTIVLSTRPGIERSLEGSSAGHVTNSYMNNNELRQRRVRLGLTQGQLAERVKTRRQSILRYGNGHRRIPGMAEVAWSALETDHISLVGMVMAGEPIEAIPQMERVEVPKSMIGRGETFALREKGTSMKDEGSFPEMWWSSRNKPLPGTVKQ